LLIHARSIADRRPCTLPDSTIPTDGKIVRNYSDDRIVIVTIVRDGDIESSTMMAAEEYEE